MGDAQFASCAAKGKYDHVPAGEACTIAVAQKLGVFDPETYFSAPFSRTTQTQSEDPVASAADRYRPAVLCSASEDASLPHVSFPLCGVAVGPNAMRQDMPDGSSSCVTSECPPGYTEEGDLCVRPTQASTVDKKSRCDARWYDWFTVENYHLRNGTQADAEGTCYAPCPTGFLPDLANDPVTGAANSLFGGGDQVGQCAPKSKGRYAGTPDFAPLAWVHRLTTRPEDFVSGTEAEIDALRASGDLSAAAEAQALANASADAGDLYTRMMAVTDAQIKGGNAISMKESYLTAGKVLNTPTRLQRAFDVALQLQTGPDAFRAKVAPAWGDQTDVRMALLTKACHLVCCDPNNAAAAGRASLCFEAAQLRPSLLRPKPAAPSPKPDQKPDEGGAQRTFFKSFKWLVWLIVVPVALVILWVTLVPALALLWAWVRYLVYGVRRPGDAEGLKGTSEGARLNEEELSRLSQKAVNDATRSEKWRKLFSGAFSSVASAVGRGAYNVGSLGRMAVGFTATKAVGAAGAVGATFLDGLVKNLLASLAVVLALGAIFVVAMFIYFLIAVNDIRFGRSGSGWTGMENFLNVFNFHDWDGLNWSSFWPVKVVNELLNPYRAKRSPDTIARPLLAGGRCDNVRWVETDGTCAATTKPDPVRWAVAFPEGTAVPGSLRTAFPTSVDIPWEETDAGFAPSCDVKVTRADGAVVPLLTPGADPDSCVKARAPLPAFSDRFRPKATSDAYAGLDRYASPDAPLC